MGDGVLGGKSRHDVLGEKSRHDVLGVCMDGSLLDGSLLDGGTRAATRRPKPNNQEEKKRNPAHDDPTHDHALLDFLFILGGILGKMSEAKNMFSKWSSNRVLRKSATGKRGYKCSSPKDVFKTQ